MCHDHKTWTSNNQTTGNAWYSQMSHFFMLFPTSGRVYIWRTSKEAYNPNAWFQQWNTWEVLWWFEQQYCGILLDPLLPFMAELLQGSVWTGWVIRCIPWFLNNNAVFQDNGSFTQLELFSHGLKSIKVNFNIIPCQHSRHILTSLNHSGQFSTNISKAHN
jgi:hypothetical protein